MVRTIRFPEHTAEGLSPHAVRAVRLFASNRPTAIVNVGAAFERKVEVRLEHHSRTADLWSCECVGGRGLRR